MPVSQEKNKAIILFLIFSFLGFCLALVARTEKVLAYLGFFWSRNFQILLKIIFASAFCLLIFRWLTHRALPKKTLKLVYGIIFLPLLILPVFRCCFKVPYVFCRICPNKCPWGISRTFIFSAFLTLNLSGRFWCFYLCPFGTFQECQVQIAKQNFRLPFRAGFLSYPVLLLTVWMYSLTLLGSQIVAYFAAGYYEWVGTTVFVALSILAAAFVIPKFWCRCFCPVGVIAELTSRPWHYLYKGSTPSNNA
jgi:polyferredoxin